MTSMQISANYYYPYPVAGALPSAGNVGGAPAGASTVAPGAATAPAGANSSPAIACPGGRCPPTTYANVTMTWALAT
jgi:hypothetical protein